MSSLGEPLCSNHIPAEMEIKKVSPIFPGKFLAIFHAILCGVVYGQLDTDHFFSTRLNIYAQCERLCVASGDCSVADYNYNTRTCYLYTQEMFNLATTSPQGPVVYSSSSKPSVCASVQCRSGEMCVMAGEGYLCLPAIGMTAPAATGSPEGTTAPAATGTASGTTAPAATGTPEGTTEPAATGTTSGTTAPAATGTTSGTTAPAATGTPDGTTAPAASGTPDGTTAPAATGTASGTTAPAATGTASGTTVPEVTGTGTTSGTTSQQVVTCGPPPEITAMVVRTETTSELVDSTVYYDCALGYVNSSGSGESECQESGIWSTPSLVCEGIPNLIGTAVSSSKTRGLTCVTKALTLENSPLTCDPGQVLVHCSVANTSPPLRGGVELIDVRNKGIACQLKTTNYTFGIVRCCSVSGLECEYLHGDVSAPEDNAQSTLECYKDFSVLGCNVHGSEDTIIDGIAASNTKCFGFRGLHEPGTPGVTVNGACCRAPDLICDILVTKNINENHSLVCDDNATMTGCMGYNFRREIAGSYMEDVGNMSTCQIPMFGNQDDRSTYVYGVCCRVLQIQ